MGEKLLVLYTMKGCIFCNQIKEKLNEENIVFSDLDIDDYSEEYSLFKDITKNEFVPAFMIIEVDKMSSHLFAPDRDFADINEAIGIIKKNII